LNLGVGFGEFKRPWLVTPSVSLTTVEEEKILRSLIKRASRLRGLAGAIVKQKIRVTAL